ncbi:hypothetical protein [Paraburkholderia rhizosphaerae]|uniref:Uncharacterized protein n=1 Tax=Paraburkholderia rhizosphaerae TaxID=480658 RepID=A0A4R8LHI1_9BURK|nr:hypothetical protein [Paraburkholderia rhizosphaerae]TDY42676.1 hypothetical protein BX592_12038 [Paraburkholderia rhizosphaerae]
MNTRVFTLASSAVALALVTGCTAVYKNSVTCRDQMRSVAGGEMAASETLTISHTGAAIRGSRVVVEGAIVSMVPASSVAAATAAWARPAGAGAHAASAPSVPLAVASPMPPATPTTRAWPPSSAIGVAGVQSPVFEAAPAGSNAVAPKTTTRNSNRPVRLAIPAAMECEFDGLSLKSYRWLAPGRLVQRADSGADASPQ